jgi:hypothetical protein
MSKHGHFESIESEFEVLDFVGRMNNACGMIAQLLYDKYTNEFILGNMGGLVGSSV